jgi:hypothetical protein
MILVALQQTSKNQKIVYEYSYKKDIINIVGIKNYKME